MLPDTTGRTDATVHAYQQTFLTLYARACQRCAAPELSMTAFVGWLGEQRSAWSKRTWWYYKAAVALGLASLEPTPDVGAARERLATLTATPCCTRSHKTSAQKAKRLTIEDLLTLYDYLMGVDSGWAPRAARWLIAGHATGLRPVEWATCEWLAIEGIPLLQVVNAKATHGRAHGVYRHLLLHACDEQTLAVIRRHRDEVQAAHRAGAYYPYYDLCRNALYRAARRCFPGRRTYPTLYSARHQFAADVKRAHGVLIAAALLGHVTTATSQRAYAQRRVGQDRSGQLIAPLPQPLAHEVERVREGEALATVIARIKAAHALRSAAPALDAGVKVCTQVLQQGAV
jgi:hypothetical protein